MFYYLRPMGDSSLLFESVFKRRLSDADTREYLTGITNEHPYFAAAHFFLLLQTEESSPAYQQQAHKTSVLFNNAWWLQFQLQEYKLAAAAISDAGITNDKQSMAAETETNYAPESAELAVPVADIGTTPAQVPVEDELKTVFNSSPNDTEPDNTPTETDTADIPEGEFTKAAIPATILLKNSGTIHQIGRENNDDIPQAPENNAECIIRQQENEIEITAPVSTAHFNNADTPLVNETDTEEGPVADEEIEPLHFKLNIDTANTTEDTITFEPLHTSDYFASLGIKLSSEIPASDKLGKQLKSFTEWLKTMKKIHGDQLPQQSGQADLTIQKLAEQSNKEAAVLTEAMAEVLLQQDKTAKAIEVYKKLSLLNPSKSAYFAAKIDQIKEH